MAEYLEPDLIRNRKQLGLPSFLRHVKLHHGGILYNVFLVFWRRRGNIRNNPLLVLCSALLYLVESCRQDTTLQQGLVWLTERNWNPSDKIDIRTDYYYTDLITTED